MSTALHCKTCRVDVIPHRGACGWCDRVLEAPETRPHIDDDLLRAHSATLVFHSLPKDAA